MFARNQDLASISKSTASENMRGLTNATSPGAKKRVPNFAYNRNVLTPINPLSCDRLVPSGPPLALSLALGNFNFCEALQSDGTSAFNGMSTRRPKTNLDVSPSQKKHGRDFKFINRRKTLKTNTKPSIVEAMIDVASRDEPLLSLHDIGSTARNEPPSKADVLSAAPRLLPARENSNRVPVNDELRVLSSNKMIRVKPMNVRSSFFNKSPGDQVFDLGVGAGFSLERALE